METTFADLHRVLMVPNLEVRVTVAGYLLSLFGWLATGLMIGIGMALGQALAS